jgi:PAS domain-containing protein
VLHKNLSVHPTPANFIHEESLIGTWECQLPFEHLTWSNEVYDLYEMPRGLRITRTEALGFYTEESRIALEAIRSGAIEQQRSFMLDVEIITALGKSRWLRITAEIEYRDGQPLRLFGTKQDITAEKLATR